MTMTVKMTRSLARAMAESALNQETKRDRRLLASQFTRDVFIAIASDRCTDARFCAELAMRTWRRVRR